MIHTDRVNILMVDDSGRKLLTYEAILAELGENLIKARSAKEALEILLRNDVGLVLLDVALPEIDGFQLAQMMREHPRFRRTPIIFISAIHIADLDQVKGYARGAVDYITVPINPELLRMKVSVFVELHRSTRRLEKMNAELALLSKHLLEAQDNERRRIARDLHDGLGQEPTYAKMMLDGYMRLPAGPDPQRPIADTCMTIDRAIQQVRSISYLLHPPMLDESGLGSAIGGYVEGFGKRSGITTSIEIDPPKFPRLRPEVETAVFRVIQESLTNVFRHSAAARAWVTLAMKDGRLAATIRDDGKGMSDEIAEFHPDKMGVGISGMRQRVKELGGIFGLGDAGPGALVEVTIPIASVDFISSAAQSKVRSAEQQKLAAGQSS